MAEKITNHPGGAITRKFDSLEELQAWAKKNITNQAVLREVMKPLVPKPIRLLKAGPGVANEPPVSGKDSMGE